MVLGEPQIFGQIKFAVATAKQQNTLSTVLLSMFNDVFYITKRVRSETDIGKHALSLGYATTQMAERIFGDLTGKNVLLLATGEINVLVAQHLLERQCAHFYICNRTAANATQLVRTLAERYPRINNHHTICGLEDLAKVLSKVDIVSSCSASAEPLISHNLVAQALKARKHKPILMVDLAIPRDIDPAVASLDDVFLYTIDDLQYVMESNSALRQSAASEAHKLTAELCHAKITAQQHASITQDLLEYRQNSEQVRLQLLDKALHSIGSGMAASEALEQLSKQLTTRLTHNPSLAIKAIAALPDESQKPLLAILKQPLRD
jgi:glutamyl-tRNA reductase